MHTKQCAQCNKTFPIDDRDIQFYSTMAVPEPSLCPDCRQLRRLSFYNMRTLYQDQCDLCGKSTLSTFAPGKPYTVYCNSCWWSDKWDALSYGVDYDFSKPFFPQLKKLLETVPQMALHADTPTMENSDYCINAGHLKDCYLTFHADFVENSYYCDNITNSKDCFDCNMVDQSELCYNSSNIRQCYRAFYSVDCTNCTDIYFSRNLTGCTNCFGSANLRNKKYCWFNQQLTQLEYEKKLSQTHLDSPEGVENYKHFSQQHWIKYPVRYMHGYKNEQVSGDYVENSVNTEYAFQVSQAENCKYIMMSGINPIRDTYDYLSWGNNVERVYECVGVGENAYNIKFSLYCWPDCRNIEYTISTINSTDVFGCVGLRKKQYCIFNKQYSLTEYQTLLSKIKQQMITTGEYGEFFPSELSQYAYNETLAQEYFPLTETEAIQQGFAWQQKLVVKSLSQADTTECAHQGQCIHQCKSVFKIIKQESDFYHNMILPLPTLCPNCRLHERLQLSNPIRLWQRQCMCTQPDHQHSGRCITEFATTYSPERKELVYCEQCYNKEIY